MSLYLAILTFSKLSFYLAILFSQNSKFISHLSPGLVLKQHWLSHTSWMFFWCFRWAPAVHEHWFRHLTHHASGARPVRCWTAVRSRTGRRKVLKCHKRSRTTSGQWMNMSKSSTGVQPPFLTSWSPSPQKKRLACPLPLAVLRSMSSVPSLCYQTGKATWSYEGCVHFYFGKFWLFQLPYGITASIHQDIPKWIYVMHQWMRPIFALSV